MSTFMVYLVFIALMWWWMSKSNKKRQEAEKALQDSLRPGVYVMLRDGFCGTIVDMDRDTLVINLSIEGADEGCVVIERSAVGSIMEGVEEE